MAGSGAWGIEIGAYALKALRLERGEDEGSARVADYVILPHAKPLSDPDAVADDVLRVTVGQFASQKDLTGDRVAISIPGHESFVRFPKLPPVEVPAKKIPGIVKFEAQQQIPFPIDEVEWDYQTFRNESSPEIEVGIFAVTKARVQRQLDLWNDVGISPDAVNLGPVAVYNALAYDLSFTEETPGTIIVDVGTTATDLIIAEAGRVWVRTFQIGGHQFTEALINAFKLSYAKAERLKREAEQSKHARHAFQAMRPVFTELAQEIQRSIGYYKSLHADANLTRLIGLGSTFQLPGLRKYLKQQLQLDVYRIERYKRLNVESAAAGEFETVSLNLGTTYGLALQGLGYETINANLMPSGEMKQAIWKRKTKWFAAAAGLAIAAGGAMFIRPLLDQAAVDAEGKPAVIDAALREYQRLQRNAADATGDLEISPIARNAIDLSTDRGPFAAIYRELGHMLADANARAAGPARAEGDADVGSAIWLDSVQALYLPPGMLPPVADGGGDDFYGGGDDDDGDDPTVDAPRVLLEVIIRTDHPLALDEFSAPEFFDETIRPWLAQHHARGETFGGPGGVTGYFAFDPESEFALQLVSGPGGMSGEAGGGPGTIPVQRVARGNTRGGNIGATPGVDPRLAQERGGGRVSERGGGGGPSAAPGVVREGGGGNIGASSGGNMAGGNIGQEAAGYAEVQALAPLDPPEGAPDPEGSAVYRLTVTAVLAPRPGSGDGFDDEGNG